MVNNPITNTSHNYAKIKVNKGLRYLILKQYIKKGIFLLNSRYILLTSGQQYFFTNPSAQQPRFVPSFQQPAPSQSQYDNFFSHLQSAYQQQQPQQSPFQLQGVFQQPYQSQPQPHQFSADVRPFGVQQRQPSFLDHITLSPTGDSNILPYHFRMFYSCKTSFSH